MNNIYYVYGLINSENNLPFYIGKGKNKRIYYHSKICNKYDECPNKYFNKHLFYKIKNIIKRGFEVLYIKYAENISETAALELEMETIKSIGMENLCNQTKGGDGVSMKHSEEFKLDRSKKSKEMWADPKFRKRMEKVSICFNPVSGEHHHYYGDRMKQETRDKMSKNMRERMKNIDRNENWNNNISKSLKGRKILWKDKISQKVKEWHKTHKQEFTKETRDKISKANKGKELTKINAETEDTIINLYKKIGPNRIQEVLNKDGIQISLYLIRRVLKKHKCYKCYSKGKPSLVDVKCKIFIIKFEDTILKVINLKEFCQQNNLDKKRLYGVGDKGYLIINIEYEYYRISRKEIDTRRRDKKHKEIFYEDFIVGLK